ncbi:DNA polymerase III subunit epsilon [Chelatococcus reniformis]|uniref:DNA polymerase III subunit epsilon n=1 Tax=Chelatococcus reniformis TaxID=1494448 RepID=A0A916TXV7_9HYPH|nr:DNA polymerase III subunit epsilon [Chelatococcus reniformis]GGC51654.1 DNA polymerase III subunit epsilon [Chelatococcus reniformis]
MTREIVLDTETTGLDAANGDRIVEIGCVELLNHIPTGRNLHLYINPQRPMPQEAFAVHGLGDDFLKDKPVFADLAAEFAEFIGEDMLIIHNAAFDIGFINAEFGRVGRPPVAAMRVLDTLALARRRHPGAGNSLDALCARYGIDNSRRTKHGALLDSEILAEVYIELIGGRQAGLDLMPILVGGHGPGSRGGRAPTLQRPVPLAPLVNADELAVHAAFVASLGDAAIWREYIELS